MTRKKTKSKKGGKSKAQMSKNSMKSQKLGSSEIKKQGSTKTKKSIKRQKLQASKIKKHCSTKMTGHSHRQSGCTSDDACLTAMLKYVKISTDKVGNFKAQQSRIEKYKKLSESKGTKNTEFNLTPIL